MKAFAAITAAAALVIVGTVIANGAGTPEPRNPVEAIRDYCALLLHFDYDRSRCFMILSARQAVRDAQ